jgi:hypothetical protein
MAGSSEYLPIATGGGANVDSQANFAGSSYQTQGFATGIAQPFQANKCWRQSSMVAAALTLFIANFLNVAVPDDGNLANLIAWIGQVFQTVPVRGQFTLPGGTLNSAGQSVDNTGIAVTGTQVAVVSILSGTIDPILTYAVTTTGGTISLVVSNTSSSTITWGPLVYNYVIL